ncbi:hypothetical protein RHGRI_031282 [Rhododendron griersonianum]|uniref:Uncharacterized protein n=1 Tax=Rhododendron griersonianum TaxID=479676 RepID=A0AAV6I791_9ERIC|nr:hypothetical protein RHGRI_031282 [Rhododendron griersonianum]
MNPNKCSTPATMMPTQPRSKNLSSLVPRRSELFETISPHMQAPPHSSLPSLIVPHGYYDNVFTYPVAVSKAGKVCSFPLEYTVELVKMAKPQITAEYFRLVADLMVIKGWPLYTVVGNFIVFDVRRLGLDTMDFGWGKPVYGSLARVFLVASFYMNFKDGIVVPICLPEPAMVRFEEELKKMTMEPLDVSVGHRPPKITSMI